MKGWAFAALALLLAPTAQGQGGPRAVVEGPDHFAVPGANETLRLTVTMDCLQVTPASGTRVAVVWQVMYGVAITGPGAVLVPFEPCLAGASTSSVSQPYTVVVPRTAPGLTAIAAILKLRVERDTAVGPPALPEQTFPFTITAEALLVSQLKLATKLDQCTDGRAVFDLEVSNLGNVRTHYSFDLGTEPSGDGWSARVPDALLLDSPNAAQGPSTASVTFVVHCPSGNKEGAFQLVVRSAAVDDPQKAGNPVTADVLARGQPFLGVPGFAGPFVALVLLGLALLARRRP